MNKILYNEDVKHYINLNLNTKNEHLKDFLKVED